MVSMLFFKGSWNVSSGLKVVLLRCFGAKIGKGVVIKPNINIKYPWKLQLGNHIWIGEGVWIDNLDKVTIEDHVCVSQGAKLLCGNHNYKSTSFDLIVAPIHLKQGSWVGAYSSVAPGVTVESHAVLGMGAVATKNLDAYSIYSGNPATKTKTREFNTD
jgi:putative colanic acid biosynthesis acetyltransferase WcaF